jgi:hypothetical protein
MRKGTLVVLPVCLSILGGCAESLYLTTPLPLIDNDKYEFMQPYFAEVDTKINVSIIPPPPPKS